MSPLLPLFAAVLFALAAPVAAHRLEACDFESDFDLRIGSDALTFSRTDGAPAKVVMAAGQLQVDGREIALSAADRARVRDFERRIRTLVPEVKALAIDAVALATEAVTTVAASFAGDAGRGSAARVRDLGAKLIERIERADDSRTFDHGAFEKEIAALTAEVVPTLVAEVGAQAVMIALSGDQAAAQRLEERAARLERDLEQAIETRAKALEVRADALCPRLAELDALEAGLELRVAGVALDLLQVR